MVRPSARAVMRRDSGGEVVRMILDSTRDCSKRVFDCSWIVGPASRAGPNVMARWAGFDASWHLLHLVAARCKGCGRKMQRVVPNVRRVWRGLLGRLYTTAGC